jgi:hypothetical protein
MTTIIFDTLDFSKRAQEAGFTKEQAEFQAKEAANAIENKIATKSDIIDVRKDLVLLQKELIIKIGTMIGLGVAILAALIKLT